MMRTLLWLMPAILLAAGCSGSGKLGTITGTVNVKGKPLNGGTISFVRAGVADAQPVTVVINPDGTYTAEGVPYGELLISVVPPPPSTILADASAAKDQMGQLQAQGRPVPQSLIDATGSAVNKTAEMFPATYSDPLTSGLSFTLDAPTATHTVDIP